MNDFITIMKALSDPPRAIALMALMEGELCVCQIVSLLGLAPSTVSKHMSILKQAGLVDTRKDSKWVYYRLTDNQDHVLALKTISFTNSALYEDPDILDYKNKLEQIKTPAVNGVCIDAHQKEVFMEQLNVLFLCTGNSCRSQMAEGYLRHLSGGTIQAFSAGLEPKPVHPMAIKVMAEKGIDISGQREKSLTEFLGKQLFDYIIFVCSQAESSCPSIYPAVRENRLKWPFPDPAVAVGTEEQLLETFRSVRDSIEQRIREWVTTITKNRS